MLIEVVGKRGFSLNEGKSADQTRFFSTEVCTAGFHQGSVTVVEFGSRPAKRARLLSDKDSSVEKDQVSSICPRHLAQGILLEESDGDVDGMPQGYRADELVSESNSGVTNEVRSRSGDLKVFSSVHTSEHMENSGDIKAPSEQTSGAQDHEKFGLLNRENIDRDAASTKPLIQQDAKDTISTSDDDGLFVIQVRSPKSRQLLHSQTQGIDQEELRSWDGAASSQTTGRRCSYDNTETLLHCHEGGRMLGYCPHKSVIAEDDENTKLDTEEAESSVEVSNIILVGGDSKLDTCIDADGGLVSIPATDLGSKNVDGSTDDQQVDESLRSGSDARFRDLADAHEPVSCDAKSLVFTETRISLGGAVQSEGAVSLDHSDQLDKVIQKAPAVRAPEAGEEPGANSSEIPKGHVQTGKQSSISQVATVGAGAVLDYDGFSKSEDAVNPLHLKSVDPPGETIIKHYVRRPHSLANSHGPTDMTEKSACQDPGVNSSEIPKVYVRTRKQSSTTQAATAGAAAVLDYDGSSKLEDAVNPLHLKNVDPPGETITKHYVRRPHSLANSHGPADMTERLACEEPGVYSSEIPKVYVRTRKQSSTTQAAPAGAAALQDYDDSAKSEDALNRFYLGGEDPPGETIIKHYVRRPHSRANSHGPADMTEKSPGLVMTSATNVSACSPQAEHHKDMSARIETEGILSVSQRCSKTNPSDQYLHKNDNIAPQKKATKKNSVKSCYVRADHQPRWLPEGWTLEIRIREGKKTPACTRDKYYHDQKSGYRFRSRNEVLQFIEYERAAKDLMESDGIDTRVQLQDGKSLPLSNAPAEHIGFQSSLSKAPLIAQTMFGSLAAPSPSFMHLHPARMKTTPVRPISEANVIAMTRSHVEGPNRPAQLPWGPLGGAVAADTGQGDQGDKALKYAVASALGGGAGNSSRTLKSREGGQLSTGSPVPAVEPPGDRGDKENRGKLILRLKRKQPDPGVGKGRSKRPTYEVVHVERPPPVTSTPTQQENSALRERTEQDVPSISVEDRLPARGISNDRSLLTPPSIAIEQPASMNATVSNNSGIKHNPQELNVLQQELYTAWGIPATARSSGLQTMASYSANHTHVFLDPVENTIPLSWQYPSTSQAFTTSAPTLGPFSSVKYPSAYSNFSIATTVPIPNFEHFPGVPSSVNLNATTALLPCSENRTSDSVGDVMLANGGSHVQKALTTRRPLTKVENCKLLLGLGRHLCKVAALEHKTRDWVMQSRPLATSLEGKSLQQRVGCSKIGG